MKIFPVLLAVFILVVGFAADQSARAMVVAPSSLANEEGDAANQFPVNCGNQLDSQRYQQLYSASEIIFGGTITAIRFRLDESRTNAFGPFTIPNLQIDLSITDTEPPNASATFDDNLGPIVQTVFDGSVTVGAPECTTTPCPFDIVIPLETPFDYDPSQGNLIMDWRLDPCVDMSSAIFDATENPEFGMQRVFNSNVDLPFGNNGNSNIGLVTQFDVNNASRTTPIPTLSTWAAIAAVLGFGFGGILALRNRRKAKKS